MQTILGSGGAIGIELAKALTEYTDRIRLVSRNPKKINENDELFPADLLNKDEVSIAVNGSDVVYLTVGLPYNIKIWEEQWPRIINNVIDACVQHNSKLVFFDNIYMYSPDNLDPITEENIINPQTKKGVVRKNNIDMLWKAVEEKGLQLSIARAADFYGPAIKDNSVLTEMVFKPLSIGKKANWLSGVNFKHSFTYTPDAGKATAILGNSEKSWGKTWHLPTAKNPLTGKEWIETIAKEFNTKAKFQVAGSFIVKLMGVFMPVMKEVHEMLYQYDKDYVFNSDKFEQEFNFEPTSYEEGIKEIIKIDYGRG